MTYTKRHWLPVKGECPACGHRGWCTCSEDGEVVKCTRATSQRPVKQVDGTTAYLHLMAELPAGSKVIGLPKKQQAKQLTRPECEGLQKQFATALRPAKLTALSDALGVSERSLKAYGVGWAGEYGAYSFPMFDGAWKPCGFRLRAADGRKLAIPGSRNGLFIPSTLDMSPVSDAIGDDPAPLLLCTPEGPTDCCAAMDVGFRAVGRPSCCGGADDLAIFLSEHPKQDVVMLAENDGPIYLRDGTPMWPGIEGAIATCAKILPHCGRLRFWLPPAGTKDLRQWVKDGGLAAVITESLMGSVQVTGDWLNRAQARIKHRKQTERKVPA